jgi:hypothetical protein
VGVIKVDVVVVVHAALKAVANATAPRNIVPGDTAGVRRRRIRKRHAS